METRIKFLMIIGLMIILINSSTSQTIISGIVIDQNNLAFPGVQVGLYENDSIISVDLTNIKGEFNFNRSSLCETSYILASYANSFSDTIFIANNDIKNIQVKINIDDLDTTIYIPSRPKPKIEKDIF